MIESIKEKVKEKPMTIREFKLERYFARWEFSAPYLLSASDCETMTIGELLELADMPLSALAELRLGYTESQGDPALRAAIARFYPTLAADHILVTNAPEEAIFLVMQTLLNPGDRVVVQTPCYQSLAELAAYRGARVQPWPLIETESGWQMDLDHLAELLIPKTKLLVINVPHNPTGYLPTLAEFETILSLVAAQGAWLFCDEMYHGLEYDPATRLPAASERYERAISLWGMSKTFGLAGLRLGWLALQDQAVLADLMRWKDYTTICSSAPGEFLARLALSQAQAIIARNLAIIQRNLSAVHDFMAKQADLFAWREPLAGPIAFARLHQDSAAAFCQQLVQDCGVLLVPASVFDFGDSHLRFGLGRRNFGEGLVVLDAYLAGHEV
jgi:aspartate/methionine/tyrosine aminotransferase